MNSLPYAYKMDEPETLLSTLTSKEVGTGAGVLKLSSAEWMITKY